MRTRIAVLSVVMCLSLFVVADETPEQFDARIEAELQALDPGAVAQWKQANAARAAGKHAEAISLYAAVYQRVPTFVHALRRQAGEELRAGDRPSALLHGREALSRDDSSLNTAFLASVLVGFTGTTMSNATPAPGELDEAAVLAWKAMRMNPDGAYEHMVGATVAMVTNNLEMLRSAVARLETLAPKSPDTHVLRATVAASEHDWDGANAALDRASSFGMPKEMVEEVRKQIEGGKPFYARWWKPAAFGLGAWFGIFALLLIAGAILSHAALRAAKEVPDSGDGRIAGLGQGVRRAYAAVLSLCCTFYYASIPIVMVVVVAVAGALLYATFAIGRIPVKLVALIVILAAVSIWSMAKSLFIRVTDDDPGMRLDLEKEPKLRALLDDVAARIGTRPVDNVYLTPGTDLAVMERGKGKKKERCLILGLAALDGFALRPFKAVLGHEYGHFSNRDTAGGAFALAVRNSLQATAVALIEGGAAAWYSPAWLFINGFHRVFMRISQGASRLQEVMADRWAVFAYGADAFERGLRHVVEQSARFDAHVGVTLKEVVDRQVPLANLYTYKPQTETEDVSAAIEESLNTRASAYDSHPSPAERFALVHALPVRDSGPEPDDESPAWSLFRDPAELQHVMTAQVRENVMANYGVQIPAPVQV